MGKKREVPPQWLQDRLVARAAAKRTRPEAEALEQALAASGFVIAWPDGEVWTHDHVAQEFPEQERTA